MAEDTAIIPTVDIDVLIRKREAPRLEALLFADYAVIGNDKKTTVAGIFDRVFVDSETKESGRFFLYIKTAETVEAPIEIRLIDPKGRIVATGSATIDPATLAESSTQSLAIVTPFGLQIGPDGLEGPYWFEIAYKAEPLGGAALRVQFRKKGD